MALQERVRGEEILIRLSESGVAGAHYQTITEILRDGVVISASMNPPVPLNLTGEGPEHLVTLLGETAATALTGLATANQTIAVLQSDLLAAYAEIEALKAQISVEEPEAT